jgi:hypothetical protein
MSPRSDLMSHVLYHEPRVRHLVFRKASQASLRRALHPLRRIRARPLTQALQRACVSVRLG